MSETDLKEPTLAEWSHCLRVMDANAVKRFIRADLAEAYDLHEPVSMLMQLQLAIADWLTHLGMLSDSQVASIIKHFDPYLREWAQTIQPALKDDEQPTLTLAVCDGRWVSCTGKRNILDVEEHEVVDELPKFAITHVICNVTALYFSMLYRLDILRKRRGNKEAGDDPEIPDPPDGEAERRGDPKTLRQWADQGSPESSEEGAPAG